MLTKNILLITLIFCVISSCQKGNNAPKKSVDTENGEELNVEKIDSINCSQDRSKMDFFDLDGQKINLCSFFNETSSDLFVIQFIDAQCDECIDSSNIIANELMSKKENKITHIMICLLYTSPSPRDKRQSRMPSSA